MNLPKPFDKMMADFLAAKQDYHKNHKSQHWDVFESNYEDRISNVNIWPEFRRNGLTAGMQTEFDKKLMEPESGMVPFDPVPRILDENFKKQLHEFYISLKHKTGAEFIFQLCDSQIGSPQVMECEGHLLNLNELFLIYSTWQIGRYVKQLELPVSNIVEIGGGYGGMAAKMKMLFPEASVFIFDLPEVNAIQRYYISSFFPQAKIFGYSEYLSAGKRLTDDFYDFVLLPGWCIDLIPQYSADVIINCRSMMEMTYDIITNYFEHIHKNMKIGGLFYCLNRYIKTSTGSPVCIKLYPYDAKWEIVLSQSCWLQTHIHELITRRTSEDSKLPPSFVMDSFPP